MAPEDQLGTTYVEGRSRYMVDQGSWFGPHINTFHPPPNTLREPKDLHLQGRFAGGPPFRLLEQGSIGSVEARVLLGHIISQLGP